MQNHYQLSGQIIRPPQLTRSPAGISHLRFVLEHQSEQIEAGLTRRSYVRITVVLSGELGEQWANELNVGNEVQVTGFLNRIEDRNGIGKLVLHGQQLVKI